MTIDEEIEILENALRGALLVPSECAFVDTQIIKICLDTLRTYESWENLIRYEIEEKIRAEAEAEHRAMCETCIHKVSKEDIDAIRESAIDECIKTIIDYCGGLPNGMYVNALKRLKENNNGR